MNSEWKPLPAGTMMDPDAQIFGIGDIHGEAGALQAALNHVKDTPKAANSTLVFTGDLIDRGPSSMECMRMAWDSVEMTGVNQRIVLPGNHELMMFEALQETKDPNSMGLALYHWVRNGGVDVFTEVAERAGPFLDNADGIAKTEACIPEGMKEHLLSHTHWRHENLMFVHAGLLPGAPLETFLGQPHLGVSGDHWAWVRDKFLDVRETKGWGDESNLVVIHGHTPAISVTDSEAEQAWKEMWAHIKETPGTDPATAIYKLLGTVSFYDQVDTHRRINLDSGCGKTTAPVPVVEFLNNQYRITACGVAEDQTSQAA